MSRRTIAIAMAALAAVLLAPSALIAPPVAAQPVTADLIVLGRAGSTPVTCAASVCTGADFAGVSIAVQENTTGESWVLDFVTSPDIRIFLTVTAMLLALLAGDVDVVIIDKPTGEDIAAANSAVDSLGTIDLTPPTLSISTPASGAFLATGNIEVTWVAADATSGIDHIEVSLDSGTLRVLPAIARSHNFTDVADGSHTIAVKAFDVAGNTATASTAVTVDTAKPTAVAGGDQTADTGETLSFDASLSSDNVAIVSYEWDFGDRMTGDGVTTTHTYEDSGSYLVTLTVRDAAGNADTDSLTVTVETLPPALTSQEIASIAAVGAAIAVVASLLVLTSRRRRTPHIERDPNDLRRDDPTHKRVPTLTFTIRIRRR